MSTSDNTARPRRYFSVHFKLFRFLGVGWWHNPDENDTRNYFGWYYCYAVIALFIWVAVFFCLESIEPFLGENDERLMFSLSFVITHDLTLVKLYVFISKNKIIQNIVYTLEIDLYNYYQNNLRNQTTTRISKVLTGTFIFFGWVTLINTSAYGTIQDFRWKAEVSLLNDSSDIPPRVLLQPIYIPWNYQNDITFVLTFLLETCALMWSGHILMSIDTFIGSLIFHLSNQFITLQEAFKTVYHRSMMELQGMMMESAEIDEDSNTVEMNNEKIELQVKSRYSKEHIELTLEKNIKLCIRQHQILIRCVEEFRDIYTYGFMTQLASSVSAICVVMVQLSQDASTFKSMKLFTSLAFFMCMLVQLAIQCFTGNELTVQSVAVSDAVMECHWEKMGIRCRRLLIIAMMRAQRPLFFTACGFTKMNNDCFVSVIKAAYSYYAVLSQKE